jgi:sec-independent protein translocase protein TatA
MGFSIQHLLLTLVIVVLVFGTKSFKNAGADLGEAIKGFRKAMKDDGKDESDILDTDVTTLEKEKV